MQRLAQLAYAAAAEAERSERIRQSGHEPAIHRTQAAEHAVGWLQAPSYYFFKPVKKSYMPCGHSICNLSLLTKAWLIDC